MSDELSRLRDIEQRLHQIVSMDPEIREYRRIWDTDEIGAILGVLDRTRDERARLELDLGTLERERDEARAALKRCEEHCRALEWQRDLQHRRVRRLAADLAETEAERRAAWGDR
jgi:chromosome segregation ATPase